ncbi:MAG: argonaute/piwi family protein [Chroococcidiopsis sp.]
MSIFLNGFKVELSASTFTAYVQDMPENKGLRALREELQDSWFLHWKGGKVYGIPNFTSQEVKFGEPVELKCEEHEHLQLLATRISSVLPEIFPKYPPFRFRPFTFLAQKEEFVRSIVGKFKNLPLLLSSFKITPKFALEAKLVELRPEETFIGLFLRLDTRWEILASLSDLQNAGINLQDLCVIRRNPQPGQRRLVGKISHISNQMVHLSESFDDISSIPENEVWLESSKLSFTRCLKTLLADKYDVFEEERTLQESKLLTGPALDKTLTQMRDFLVKKSLMQLAPDLQARIGSCIEVVNDDAYQTVISASPVEYCFDSARTKRSQYAWSGIEQYGPFSREIFSKKSPEILVLFPDTVQGAVENFLRAFRDGISIKKKVFRDGIDEWEEKSRYAGGFAKIFGLVNPKFTQQKISWLNNTHKSPDVAYKEAVKQTLKNREVMPDAAIVVLLDEHAKLPDPENPYLQSKALLLMAGIPVQDIRLRTLGQHKEALQYTLQNLSVALYAKMNGLPWTVDRDLTISDELVIGIGTCELSGNRFTERQRFVGITTVFRGDGNYLLGNLSEECSYDEYPNILRESTVSILQEIKKRNGWQPGDTVRLVFHATKPLKNVEIAEIIAECVAEVGEEQNIEFAFLTVSHDHPFFLLDKSQQGIITKGGARKGTYAPERGKILQLGRYTRLLCTNGPKLIKKASSPLPTPLLINLHPRSTYRDLTYLSEQVLKFTSLSWRSLLPAAKPVTIYYSELIAELLARLRNIRGWSPAMLNIKLRASKWFL